MIGKRKEKETQTANNFQEGFAQFMQVLSDVNENLKKLVFLNEQQFKAAGQPIKYPQKETTQQQQKEGE